MKLKKTAKQHLQGAALLIIGYLCYKAGASGAAVFAWILAFIFLLGEEGEECHTERKK